MSVSSVISALQAQHATLTGITSAPTRIPASLNTALLPIVITLPASGTWAHAAIGLNRQDRSYKVRLYVAPVAQGEGVDEGYQDTITLIQTLGASYVDWPTWVGTSFEQLREISDSGHIVMSYAGTAFHGCEFTLSIAEKPL